MIFWKALQKGPRLALKGLAVVPTSSTLSLGFRALRNGGSILARRLAFTCSTRKRGEERVVNDADSSELMSWSCTCCLQQDLGGFLVAWLYLEWAEEVSAQVGRFCLLKIGLNTRFLLLVLWVCGSAFHYWVCCSSYSKVEGNNSFKEGNPHFQLKEKYCRDLQTWWTSAGRRL